MVQRFTEVRNEDCKPFVCIKTPEEIGRTLNLFLFETEDAARMAAERMRGAPRPPFMRLDVVELREVLAHF